MVVWQYRFTEVRGFVANNQKTVLVKVLSALGAAAGATVLGSLVNGEYLGLFDQPISRADTLMAWTDKMVRGTATQNDRFTYPHKVNEFYSAVNDYAERMVEGMWDIDGARIAETFIIERMYLDWVTD